MIRKTRTIAQLAEYFPSIHEALDSVPAQHKLAFSWRILGESEIQGHLWLLSKLRPACNTDLVTKEVCKHSTKYIFFFFFFEIGLCFVFQDGLRPTMYPRFSDLKLPGCQVYRSTPPRLTKNSNITGEKRGISPGHVGWRTQPQMLLFP